MIGHRKVATKEFHMQLYVSFVRESFIRSLSHVERRFVIIPVIHTFGLVKLLNTETELVQF